MRRRWRVSRRTRSSIFPSTRTATKTLLAPGVRGAIGIGRVKTPTLAIVCLRELEIRNFQPEDYFEIVATATVAGGSFLMRHAPSAKVRIKDRPRGEAIAKAAAGHQGLLGVSIEQKRQAPPRLFDLPTLQKTCGQRWGWTADKTLSVAQELYDGAGKKLITYPRAEARYLTENQISDVPAIVAALTRLRGFAQLEIAPPVIRRGKSGHFCDKRRTIDLIVSTPALRSGRRPGRQAGSPANPKELEAAPWPSTDQSWSGVGKETCRAFDARL